MTAILAAIIALGSVGQPAIGVQGTATWYAYHPGQAAAGARLRNALGPNWRGMTVEVCGPAGCKVVRLTDYEASTIPGRLVDLDSRDFPKVCGPLSLGVCHVTVTTVEAVVLPPTDALPDRTLFDWLGVVR